MVSPFQWPMVHMVMFTDLLVGGMLPPPGSGMGCENVPVMTPVHAVQSPSAILMGCSLMLWLGIHTKSAFRSSMCCASPVVVCPSGQYTTMFSAWLLPVSYT